MWQKVLSEVGFEPTPSSEDQNSHCNSLPESKVNLESGALDHSAILTSWQLKSKFVYLPLRKQIVRKKV